MLEYTVDGLPVTFKTIKEAMGDEKTLRKVSSH